MRPERNEPMTLGNMRRNGIRTLAICCGAVNCHRQAVLDVEHYPDDAPVPSFRARMWCSVAADTWG